jgi:sugar O-acyltransferase (sialic acid O-acetyltransferase NeuD family)
VSEYSFVEPFGKIVLIGYSGHAYVVADILLMQECGLLGYMENENKQYNPYNLDYLGSENNVTLLAGLKGNNFFVAIGDNSLRRKIYQKVLITGLLNPCNAIHPRSVVADKVSLDRGICVMAGAIINPLSVIGKAVIINSGAIVEHECKIEDFVHIAPGAVLAGNVKVGENSFIGANSVVKQNISIGRNVLIGAGSVIVKDVPDGAVLYGNPGKII